MWAPVCCRGSLAAMGRPLFLVYDFVVLQVCYSNEKQAYDRVFEN